MEEKHLLKRRNALNCDKNGCGLFVNLKCCHIQKNIFLHLARLFGPKF
jgi:hypothetical protein